MKKIYVVRRLFVIIIFMLITTIPLKAQNTFFLNDGRIVSSVSTTKPIRDITEVNDGLIVKYTIENAIIYKDTLFSNSLFWKIEGFGVNDISTQGAYPYRIDSYTIPDGYSAQVTILDSSFVDYDYCLAPARQPVIESKTNSYVEEIEPIKPFTGFYPQKLVNIGSVDVYRGTGIARVIICPLQYNYEKKRIRFFSTISYKVTFTKEQTVSRIAKTSSNISESDYLLNNTTINGYPKQNQRTVLRSSVSDARDYLILSCPKYGEAISLFSEWKKTLGFNVHTVFKDEWTSTSIKKEVQRVYDENPNLYYLLIVGDHNDLPGQSICLRELDGDPYCHCTDMYYACMDGDNDSVPDLYYGRLSVSSRYEAFDVIDKIIQYEKFPSQDNSFYNTGLNCAYFEDGTPYDFNKADGYEDKRFIKTSEEVRDYLAIQNKKINRVYFAEKRDIKPSFYNNMDYSFGEPLPKDLKDSTIWNGNATDINRFINQGAFYVLYRGHGLEKGWNMPTYEIKDFQLSNKNKYPVVFSLTCLTGNLEKDCFAEKLLRMRKSGCVAIYASSEVSYSGYNDALCCGMFDAIWPVPGLRPRFKYSTTFGGETPIPTYELGQILRQGMTRMKETYGQICNKYTKYTEEIFYCYGDPSMLINTDIPTSFEDVKITRNGNNIYVTTKEEAKISFYNQFTNKVYCTKGNSAHYTDENADFTLVCISNHNKIPYIDVKKYLDILYLQNDILCRDDNFEADKIEIGSNVTIDTPKGDFIFRKGKVTMSASEVTLESGTIIEKGAEVNILTNKK